MDIVIKVTVMDVLNVSSMINHYMRRSLDFLSYPNIFIFILVYLYKLKINLNVFIIS